MNDDITAAIRTQLSRQIAHWTIAVSRLENLDDLASPAAWNGLERYTGLSIRQHLTGVIEGLKRQANLLRAAFDSASTRMQLESVRRLLLAFRKQYLRAETTLDFFADAVNTRTNPTVAGLLRACDSLAERSMAQILDQLGKPTPIVLTYLDKGLGASILKVGLRLWDGTGENPVAAIKITLHNLHRPTSLIHETGHQVAHIAGWNEELASVLRTELRGAPAGLGEIWASWTSEIAADAFAFVHTGYASVAALHDVLAGEESAVFRQIPGDPHPTGYIRVLLGVEMCRQFYGKGPWDDLALAWTEQYPLEKADAEIGTLLRASLPLLPNIVDALLRKPMRAFGERPLSAMIDPGRVSPKALVDMEHRLGVALFTSMHWIWTESLRLLALNGLHISMMPEKAPELLKQQVAWMLRLGGTLQAA
jgi:hypothetical protein